MSEEKTIIEFKNIVKTYGKDEAKTYALNEVNFSINEGEFIAIMGASGSGKSTSMNIIGCLDNPSSGEYLFNGINVEKLNRNQLALIRKNYIGFVFQGFNLLGRTSSLENVELPLIYRRIPAKQRKELAMNALRKVGLESVAHNAPSQLSGGQQQRVAIARALVTNPLIILADEPTGNLDSIKSLEIMDLLKQLNKESNITIIMVTHEEDVAEHCKRIIRLKDGVIEKDEIVQNRRGE